MNTVALIRTLRMAFCVIRESVRAHADFNQLGDMVTDAEILVFARSYEADDCKALVAVAEALENLVDTWGTRKEAK